MLKRQTHARALGPLLLMLTLAVAAQASPPQTIFTVLGNVSLPDGKPASRVTVRITGMSGLNVEVQSDDQGRYQFFNIPAGRYRVTAINRSDPSLYTDPAEADTSRIAGNARLIVHLYFKRAPENAKDRARPGVISVAEATQQVPKEARKVFEEGIKQRSNNQVGKALASFNRAIKLFPDYFQALSERGELKISRNLIAEAAEDFDQALKINQDHGPALRGAGYCKLEQQKYAEAVEYLDRAILAEPDNPTTHLFLGIANLALDRREQAMEALQQALKLDARRAVTAHIYLADVLARQQLFKEAADELNKYLEAKPDAPNADRLKAQEAELRARVKTP